MRYPLAVLLAATLGLVPLSSAAEDAAPSAAVLVNNLAGSALEQKVGGFQAMIAGQLASRGLSVIDPKVVTETLEQAPPDLRSPLQSIASQSSALRLAQLIGADYLLVANLVSLAVDQRRFSGSGVTTDNRTYTLRVAYGFLDASEGASLQGDSFSVSAALRQDKNIEVDDQDIVNQLLQEAAQRLAGQVVPEAGQPPVLPKLPGREPVAFSVITRLQGLGLPNVTLSPDHQIQVSERRFPVEAVGVDVALNGVVIGSAPGEFTARPGLHRLTLTRQGFEPWERNINVYEGFTLTAAMNLTPAGLAEWERLTAFLQKLQNQTQLSDAEAEVLRGQAQALRQSGYRVDTSEAPTVNVFPSLWGPPWIDGKPVPGVR